MPPIPLTPLQASLVLASVGSTQSGSYVLQNILELPEQVQAAVLKEAWDRVAAVGWTAPAPLGPVMVASPDGALVVSIAGTGAPAAATDGE